MGGMESTGVFIGKGLEVREASIIVEMKRKSSDWSSKQEGKCALERIE